MLREKTTLLSVRAKKIEINTGGTACRAIEWKTIEQKKALAYNEKRRRENEGYRTIVDRELLLLLCFCVLAPISGERETLVNSYLSGIVFPGHFWLL